MEAPARIEVQEGRRVVITWEDGSTSSIDARSLRAACQCASCRESAGREATRRALEGEVGIVSAHLVGAYAVNFVFEPDAHGTGIYTFEMLRELG